MSFGPKLTAKPKPFTSSGTLSSGRPSTTETTETKDTLIDAMQEKMGVILQENQELYLLRNQTEGLKQMLIKQENDFQIHSRQLFDQISKLKNENTQLIEEVQALQGSIKALSHTQEELHLIITNFEKTIETQKTNERTLKQKIRSDESEYQTQIFQKSQKISRLRIAIKFRFKFIQQIDGSNENVPTIKRTISEIDCRVQRVIRTLRKKIRKTF